MGILLALVLSALLWVAAQPAHAQTTTAECQTKIANLKVATQNATFIGQNAEKNRTGLIGKLDQASRKLAEGKNQDAIQKLTDFRTAVESLLAGGKISDEDAATLIAGANDAIACIQELDTTAVA